MINMPPGFDYSALLSDLVTVSLPLVVITVLGAAFCLIKWGVKKIL